MGSSYCLGTSSLPSAVLLETSRSSDHTFRRLWRVHREAEGTRKYLYEQSEQSNGWVKRSKQDVLHDRGRPRRTPKEDAGYATAPSRVEGKQNEDVEATGEEGGGGGEDWMVMQCDVMHVSRQSPTVLYNYFTTAGVTVLGWTAPVGDEPSRCAVYSVSHANEIVGQLLHRRCCVARLNSFRIVCDENGLLGLHTHDALFPLRRDSVTVRRGSAGGQRTFLPYTLLSSVLMVIYLIPPMWKPFICIDFVSAVSA